MNLSELNSSHPIRISRRQLELLVADLEPLHWKMLTTMCSQWFFDALPSDCDKPLFVYWHKRLKKLWLELKSFESARQQSYYRVSLDVFVVGICITAVRAAMRTKGRSTPASTIPNIAAARRRRAELLRCFENYERQLRRRFRNEWDNPKGCARLIHQVALYRKALVREFFRPLPVFLKDLPILSRELFESLVKVAEDGLKKSGSEIPPPKELRKLVSRWLRKVRLIRETVSIPDLLRDPSLAKSRLIPFIQTRWARTAPDSTRKPDMATIRSERAERLRAAMPEVD